MNGPRWAKRIHEATITHMEIWRTAHADRVITPEEAQMIEASGEDVRLFGAIVDAGDELAMASQRASDPEYLGDKLAKFQWLVSQAPMPPHAA